MSRRAIALLVVLPVAIFAAYVSARATLAPQWQKWIYIENGPIELGTAVMFAIAATMASTLCRRKNRIPGIYCSAFLLFAGLCTFVALEEISYGQQLFGWASPEWFEQNNHHGQTNLHNLMGNRPAHVLKNVGTYGTLAGFIVAPIVAMFFRRAYRPGHWSHFLLPRLEILVIAALAQLCTFLWDAPKSFMGEYWHHGWNELRELYWGTAAVAYISVIRKRLLTGTSRLDHAENRRGPFAIVADAADAA